MDDLQGNKVDLSEKRVDEKRVNKYASEKRVTYIGTSAKLGININEPFSEIVKQIHNKV